MDIEDRSFYIKAKIFTDQNLKALFAINKNITKLHLHNLSINGECLLKLPLSSIQELELDLCNIGSLKYLNEFYSSLRNLKIFKLIHSSLVIHNAINAFNFSDNENFTHISITCNLEAATLKILPEFMEFNFQKNSC